MRTGYPTPTWVGPAWRKPPLGPAARQIDIRGWTTKYDIRPLSWNKRMTRRLGYRITKPPPSFLVRLCSATTTESPLESMDSKCERSRSTCVMPLRDSCANCSNNRGAFEASSSPRSATHSRSVGLRHLDLELMSQNRHSHGHGPHLFEHGKHPGTRHSCNRRFLHYEPLVHQCKRLFVAPPSRRRSACYEEERSGSPRRNAPCCGCGTGSGGPGSGSGVVGIVMTSTLPVRRRLNQGVP